MTLHYTFLLSLLLPSCIVVSIKDLGNITSDTLTIHESTLNMTASNDMSMGVDSFSQLFQSISNFFDEIQGHSLLQSTHSPRTLFIFSSKCEKSYAEHLEKLNDRINKDEPIVISNSKLSNDS